MEVDRKTRRRIQELGRALSAAIAESEEACRALDQLQSDGYALYLLVGADDERLGRRRLPLLVEAKQTSSAAPSVRPSPSFRIHGEDLAFLHSIGIDPTRRPPRRKS